MLSGAQLGRKKCCCFLACVRGPRSFYFHSSALLSVGPPSGRPVAAQWLPPGTHFVSLSAAVLPPRPRAANSFFGPASLPVTRYNFLACGL